MVWRIDDPQGNEAAKVKYDIVPFTRGVVLDLGCGPFKAFPHFIGVDNGHHAEEFGWRFKPDIAVETCERLEGEFTKIVAEHLGVWPEEGGQPKNAADSLRCRVPDASCDAVFSSHLLEHIEDTEGALAEWWRVIKPGGHLCLYLPHRELYPNVGEEGANPDHKHDFVPGDVTRFMATAGKASGFDLVVDEIRPQDCEYSFLQVYRRRDDGVIDIRCWDREQEARRQRKSVCIVRYGGFGDMMQTSSLFPQFKRMGYHVTVMTTPRGEDVVRHDPNIDAFLIQDTDQVPNGELANQWFVWAKKFDRFVNLSESVEANLLAMPGTSRHMWPDDVRRKYLNVNYSEFTHELAGLPFQPNSRFYPTAEERERVVAWLGALGSRAITVMWCLAGSSVHKVYPWMDQVMASILVMVPNVHFLLVGDEACQLLERGWENEPRVHRFSGKLGIRETLALAQQVDCVVGPETGVLNAVAYDGNGKVVILSHSTVKNLTKHWNNTVSLAPTTREVPCYPCHRMHNERTFCPEAKVPVGAMFPDIDAYSDEDQAMIREHVDERGLYATGSAACAFSIDGPRVATAIRHRLAPRVAAIAKMTARTTETTE